MKIALKLIAAYLAASLVMTVLSVSLNPPHAHLPTSVVFLTFPLVPLVTAQDLYAGDAGSDGVLLAGVFLLVFGGLAWLALRSR
ncbi:hypothetical protein [Achromobacter xylosoxidans]|uniref:hypothetical protein n=1 Tax=Alcaligenes xylosoxydans xylosoxydans TaxID=85698 RepID=UPI000B491DB4|nr:hypothetical protein [Achromobacter xylosoxidans]